MLCITYISVLLIYIQNGKIVLECYTWHSSRLRSQGNKSDGQRTFKLSVQTTYETRCFVRLVSVI